METTLLAQPPAPGLRPLAVADGHAIQETLRAAVSRERLGRILGADRLPHAESVEAIRDAAATAITFRLLQAPETDWIASAPPLEPEFLTRVRQAVSLAGVRRAIVDAGLVPQLHPYALHAALTVELASIAWQSLLRAADHGCHICTECIGVATHRTTAEAELALALVAEAA